MAIMQPYFLPYIGYYQLMAAVDLFIVYDNIKYTKKGWINRNRMLQNGADAMFSVPLKNDSDALDIRERQIAVDFKRDKLLNQLRATYGKAPYFEQTFPLIEGIVRHEDANLFGYLHHAIEKSARHLGIGTPIRVSSTVPIDHALKGQDKVIALCAAVGADTYVNPPGGVDLYSGDAFREKDIDLKFIRPRLVEYAQFGQPFVPWLSIVDVLMFNSIGAVSSTLLKQYDLI
nr:WbqC family protein [Propionivibrio soli]